ncbi:uncharacterized protein B0H18DRAFT_591557 [Fomitopsis serialis]|uniref:uncharacterized protein n=1 Tax=Fomitopsis serialis TaxID=139415 RepID=UPI002008E54F|nr:uncharacterized protein B0H18DRAFT_591557 [Neoantrodia serialis]KAH9907636.1 hypothetical protein B0H18DRAFT_591557 [Neoantrodia serialis]
MRSIPVTLQRFRWEMREYQRYYAEASAYMDFVNTFNARMVDTKVHQTDSSLMGAISADPAVVSRLYRAGIPVWYIRRYSQLVPELKIQEVVEPSLPQERGVMILEYDPPYPTQYVGPPGLAHLSAVHTFGMRVYSAGIPDPGPASTGSLRRPLNPDSATSSSRGPSKKSKAAHKAPPPTGSTHTPPTPKAGRDHFVDADSSLIPPPITQWSKALERVQNDPARLSKDRLPSGHYCPNPATFATANSLARFLETWLTIRPAWLAHMQDAVYSDALVPYSKPIWNALLVMTDEQRRTAAAATPTSAAKSAKHRVEAMQAFGRFFPTDDFATPSTLQFFEFTVKTPIREVVPSLARKVVWELYELSFRLELAAVDFKLTRQVSTGRYAWTQRRAEIAKCFPNGSLVLTQYPASNGGLASLQSGVLAAYVEHLRRVLAKWPNASSLQRTLRPEDHPNLILEVEHDVVSFYCQAFYDLCGRAAVVPHRLPAD